MTGVQTCALPIYVCFGPKNQGLTKEEAELRAFAALKSVGLPEEVYYHSPFDLSGGQKRRVAIAGVLAMQPEVLILDEPTAGLDPKGRDEILDQVAKLHKERGITGCVANGIEEATAQAIYDEIFDFANYAFNKAHAVSYAVVAYQTAYFKCHYTKEYMAALLTSVLDNSDKVAGYIGECRECGIALLPPDVNRSYDRFTVEPEGIRFGLVAIKNIGRGFIQSVVREREQRGFFRSFQDFCQRMYDCGDMNKRAVENLIRSGTFDSLGDRRSQLIAVYETVLDAIGSTRRQNVEGQLDMFGGSSGQEHEAARIHLPDIPEYSATERMHMEKETTGLYLSGHPMTDWRPTAQRGGAVPIHEIMDDFASEDGPVRFADGQNVTVAGIVTSSRTRTTKNNTLMAYVVVEDETAAIELLRSEELV